jgi:hypothetical protein
MDINNETKIYDKKTQSFSWNLKLNNNLLHLKKPILIGWARNFFDIH